MPDVRGSFAAVVGELDGLGRRGRVLGRALRYQTAVRSRLSNDIVRHVRIEALAGVAMITRTFQSFINSSSASTSRTAP